MKLKKVYIGIAAVTVSLIIVIASIFYIKANHKDVELAEFEKNSTEENTKEAMEETKEVTSNENANEKSEAKVEEAKQEPKKEAAAQTVVKEEKKETTQAVKQETKKEIQVTPLKKTMYVKASNLNVRSGPDTSYSKIGSLSYAKEVKITGKSGVWYRISYNGKTGYVKGEYLSDSKPEPKVVEENKTATVTSTTANKTTSTASASTSSNKVASTTANKTTSTASTSTTAHLIVINSKNNTLRYYVSGKLKKAYSCATGTSGTPTPQGKFKIFEKLVNRPYYKLNIPGGAPNNPLGPRWMQFKSGGYAIHGTNVESSIGTNASHGCVRMHNADVIELYSMVPNGATVIVKNTTQSDKEIAAGYGISIE